MYAFIWGLSDCKPGDTGPTEIKSVLRRDEGGDSLKEEIYKGFFEQNETGASFNNAELLGRG